MNILHFSLKVFLVTSKTINLGNLLSISLSLPDIQAKDRRTCWLSLMCNPSLMFCIVKHSWAVIANFIDGCPFGRQITQFMFASWISATYCMSSPLSIKESNPCNNYSAENWFLLDVLNIVSNFSAEWRANAYLIWNGLKYLDPVDLELISFVIKESLKSKVMHCNASSNSFSSNSSIDNFVYSLGILKCPLRFLQVSCNKCQQLSSLEQIIQTLKLHLFLKWVGRVLWYVGLKPLSISSAMDF